MFQGNLKTRRRIFRAALIVLMTCAGLTADGPLVPLTVCEVLHDLPAQNGKSVAVLGRYSFRANGRWMAEESCGAQSDTPSELWLVEDVKDGPKAPSDFEIDGATLHKKLTEMQKHTALGKFKFGTLDYDRWAVIYGAVQLRKGDDLKKAPANLVFRGSGLVVFVNPEE